MNDEWRKLYEAAMSVIKPYELSNHIYIGGVGAAVLTAKGNIYTGICVDTSCGLGICAERNAITTMLTNGEYDIKRVCAVFQDGTVMPPCGACREFMIEMGSSAKDIEILINNNGKIAKLYELMPEYPY